MCARVLVVDDDPINVDLIGYLLSAFGHEPVVALGGQSAVEQAAAHVPDLVLCDIQMPDVDGFEVLRRLRAEPRFAATPIVGVTALAMVGDREKILAAGFDGYLTKPISPETFIADIERFLPPELASRSAVEQADPPAPSHEQPKAAALPRREGYALVVDDHRPNVELLHHLISSLGVEVRMAVNVDDALRIARDVRPALIVSDLHMPRTDGLKFLETVRTDAVLERVPFVLISSTQASAGDARRARALGVDDMLLRPIDAETMLEQLTRWIPMEKA